jgi:TolB-like protein
MSASAPVPRAVFLSYASQDAEAARRICETLRSAGVEVWFDTAGGLEHGDEWDAKIRRQIKDCVLFIPLISANTQSRHEGYFRIEWALAAERAVGIADGVAFILPALIDGTREPDALVPDRFRKVQWTRLPGGEIAPEVRTRLLKLWAERSGLTPASPPTARAAASEPPALPAPIPVTHETAAPADKSLVILPLENLSPDPDNAFFTEGMHTELIATLQRTLPELKVISRATALVFRTAGLTVPEFARKVGVANVLTGSVRRAGNTVRILLELRRAEDDAPLWTPAPFNRELKDTFAVQDEIAAEVARALQVRQATGTSASARFWIGHPRAYDLFLKAKEIVYTLHATPARRREAVRLLEEARQLDPGSWLAGGYLSVIHTLIVTLEPLSGEDRARHATEAKRLAELPMPAGLGGLGNASLLYYYLHVEWDLVRALPHAERCARALPGEAESLNLLAYVFDGLGRRSEALGLFRRAIAIDPLNIFARLNELEAMLRLRRTESWHESIARVRADFRGPETEIVLAEFEFRRQGTLPGNFAAFPAGSRDPWHGFSLVSAGRTEWAMRARQFAEVVESADATLADPQTDAETRFHQLCLKSEALHRLGHGAPAQAAAENAVAIAERFQAEGIQPEFIDLRLSRAFAAAGRSDEAFAAGERSVQQFGAKGALGWKWLREERHARVLARLGRVRESVELIHRLLHVSSGLTVPALQADPDWDNLRTDPEFQALLAAPENSAPL